MSSLDFKPNLSGTGLGKVPKVELERRKEAGNEPNTLGALNGEPSYFRKNQFKDALDVKNRQAPRIQTELNRQDTIRNMGMAKSVNTNASPNLPVYRFQGHIDPQVAKFRNASSQRNRKLQNRCQKQLHAENVSIIMDRPYN